MTFVHILTPLLVAIPITSIAGIYGFQAQQLRLPTGSLTLLASLFMLAGYWGCLLFIPPNRVARYRTHIAVAVSAFFAAYPVLLVGALSISLPLARALQRDEIQHLRILFPHPFVQYSASGEGDRLRIRRADRNDALLTFLASIHATGNAQPSAPPDHRGTRSSLK